MKYGDVKSHSEASRALESHLFKDFPFQVFLQRTELITGTLETIVSTADIVIFKNCVSVLLKFIETSIPMYRFILNPYNRFPEINNHFDSQEVELLNDIAKWKKIDFNPDIINSTSFDSCSLPLILCEIASKALDCVLHEEKVGCAFVVYRATIKAFTQIYDVYRADEFVDIFIKILNSFDYILTSLNMTSTDIDHKNILLQAIPALKIVNSIFNREEYKSDPNKYHPKTQILIQATIMFQQELRKSLFDMTFDKNQTEIVLEYFSYKSKLDAKDFNLVKSYHRALDAAQVSKLAEQFELSNIEILENEEVEITSPSEFTNLYEILEKLLICIDLKLDFKFESCLLKLVEYSELMENSNLESHVEEVTTLFINYLKLPIEEIKVRILKRCIMRLQLREELLRQQDVKIKSKFLTSFLTRAPIIKFMLNDLLLSNLPNPDFSSESLISELLIKYATTLVSC